MWLTLILRLQFFFQQKFFYRSKLSKNLGKFRNNSFILVEFSHLDNFRHERPFFLMVRWIMKTFHWNFIIYVFSQNVIPRSRRTFFYFSLLFLFFSRKLRRDAIVIQSFRPVRIESIRDGRRRLPRRRWNAWKTIRSIEMRRLIDKIPPMSANNTVFWYEPGRTTTIR